MGVRLIVEVLDHWRDAGLTAGERDDLVVLAENANDGSRQTWGPVHEPYILRRVNKSAASWRIAINKLMKKGVLEYAVRDGKEVRGRTGQTAVYRLAVMCPEAPHDGWKGFCTRPAKGDVDVSVGSAAVEEGHLAGDPLGYLTANPVEGARDGVGYPSANPEGYPTANAVEGVGYLTAAECVSGELTPTPLFPSFKIPSKTSSSLAAVSSSPAVHAVVDGGGGGGLSFEEEGDQDSAAAGSWTGEGPTTVGPSGPHPQAESLVAALDFRGRPPGARQRQQLVALVAAALGAGWVEQDLKGYLDLGGAAVNSAAAVYAHRLGAGELPDPEAFRAASRRPLVGTDTVVDGWMQLAHRSDPHRPSGDAWRRLDEEAASGARPAGWETSPHCGRCDEVTRRVDGGAVCTSCHPAMRF
ncbi:hypothetical protein OG786_29240 [Streptomyces sp. NBC_00101]|uniref:hypothetical protein n=1 Tax=Streptomyces sp. NBC_00101 TaxID=2975651 RepID=UPI0032545E03